MERAAGATAPAGRPAAAPRRLDLVHPAGIAIAFVCAVGFGFTNPGTNRPAAAVLLAVCLLCILSGRFLTRQAAQVAPGVARRMRGFHDAVGVAELTESLAVLVAAGLRPTLFPLFAAILAGLLAMGAIARWSLGVTMTVALDRQRDPDQE